MRTLLTSLLDDLDHLEQRIAEFSKEIDAIAHSDETIKRLLTIPGVGPLGATALVAAAGDGKQFRKARDMTAWLGLVPAEHSSAGKQNLLGISKLDNGYVRRLLIHDAQISSRPGWQNQPLIRGRIHLPKPKTASNNLQPRGGPYVYPRISFHAAILGAPFVDAGTAHRVLAAQLGGRHAALHLAQRTHDLGLCKSCILHRNLRVHPAEKIPLPHPHKMWGITLWPGQGQLTEKWGISKLTRVF